MDGSVGPYRKHPVVAMSGELQPQGEWFDEAQQHPRHQPQQEPLRFNTHTVRDPHAPPLGSHVEYSVDFGAAKEPRARWQQERQFSPKDQPGQGDFLDPEKAQPGPASLPVRAALRHPHTWAVPGRCSTTLGGSSEWEECIRRCEELFPNDTGSRTADRNRRQHPYPDCTQLDEDLQLLTQDGGRDRQRPPRGGKHHGKRDLVGTSGKHASPIASLR